MLRWVSDLVAFDDGAEDVAVVADELFALLKPEGHHEVLIGPEQGSGFGVA